MTAFLARRVGGSEGSQEPHREPGATVRGGGGGPALVQDRPQRRGCWPASPTSRLSLQIIRKALSEEKRVSTKTSAADLVTETDHMVEALILQELQQRFPSHRWVRWGLADSRPRPRVPPLPAPPRILAGSPLCCAPSAQGHADFPRTHPRVWPSPGLPAPPAKPTPSPQGHPPPEQVSLTFWVTVWRIRCNN